ncbi:MAG: hydroxymethylbilane synthase, partial [Ectothiorhodospiraceae bacterium]|nr:hydroxymethylbilane synthase [Ectothiorhodospiraceae bacterium]
LFTKELERALLQCDIDIAVHSLKDMETTVPEGLRLTAITKREKVNDVLISKKWKSLEDLPEGATVATGSLRRCSQLKHLRPDLNIVDLRGNLNTRFAKFDESKWDAMILAYAGVLRLGWSDRIAATLPTQLLLPAVGQGALGIEIRESDRDAATYLAALNHEESWAACVAERALLRTLQGGCQVPVAAYARMEKEKLVLDAMVGSLDGTLRLDARGTTSKLSGAEAMGVRVANKLLREGAEDILEDIRGSK